MSTEETFDHQPDELNAMKATVKEFLSRMESIDNEIETLKEDRKELIEEYKEKLDVKTLQEALKVLKIKAGVKHKDTFDAMIEILEDPAQ
jgi:uncharacterized protein (UPF0335 family)